MRNGLIILIPVIILMGCAPITFITKEYNDRKIPNQKKGIFVNEFYVSNGQM